MATADRLPTALVAVADPVRCARVRDRLAGAGWLVHVPPTALGLIAALAGPIEDHETPPDLLVVDAWSRGCAGPSLVAGLRALGIATPVVLVVGPGDPWPRLTARDVHVVAADRLDAAVDALARGRPRPWPPPAGGALAARPAA